MPFQEQPTAGPAVRAWIKRAYGKLFSDDAQTILRDVDELSEADAEGLLRVTLDAWAVSEGTRKAAIGLGGLMDASRRQQPVDPTAALREAGIQVVTLDDLDLPDDVDPDCLAPNYGVVLMKTALPDGRPLPTLVLYPETKDAGIEDLERRTDWQRWGLHGMPQTDPRWRVRARISDRSLQGLVYIGPDGEDDHELWRAAESVSLPTAPWDLLDTAQHMLIAGPVKNASVPGALQAAADTGELLAVVARVSFNW